MKTRDIMADVQKDIIPDAKQLLRKYSMEQIELLLAIIKALETKSIL